MLMRIRRFGGILLAVAMLAALLAACSSSSTGSTTSSTKKEISITSIVQPLDNPWVVNDVMFQKQVAKALGIKLTVVADQGTEQSNIEAVQSAAVAAPNGILFDPYDQAAGLKDGQILQEYKIPGVTEDRLVVPNISSSANKYLVAQDTESDYSWGYDMMMALINKHDTKIVAIMDPHGVTTVEQAWQGALAAVKQHPGVTVLQTSWQPKSRENAIATMQRYLVKYPQGAVDGCWCIGSTVGEGAYYAVQQAGRAGQITISTSDDDPSVISLIAKGELSATFGTHWMVGGFGLITLYDDLHGHAPLNRQPQFHLFTIDKQDATAYEQRFYTAPFTPAEIRKLSLTYDPKANLPCVMANLYKTWQTSSRGLACPAA